MKYSELKAAMDDLKKSIQKEVEEIDVEFPNVKPIKGSTICFTVKFSELAGGGILSPFYYSADSQKREVAQIVSQCTSLETIVKKLNKIVCSGKLPDGREIHPLFQEKLRGILETNGCVGEEV